VVVGWTEVRYPFGVDEEIRMDVVEEKLTWMRDWDGPMIGHGAGGAMIG
jgi:hypothetical protein